MYLPCLSCLGLLTEESFSPTWFLPTAHLGRYIFAADRNWIFLVILLDWWIYPNLAVLFITTKMSGFHKLELLAICKGSTVTYTGTAWNIKGFSIFTCNGKFSIDCICGRFWGKHCFIAGGMQCSKHKFEMLQLLKVN